MKKLRKPLSLLLTLTMVLSLFCGMSTVAHAAPYSNDYIDFEFSGISLLKTDLTVYVQDEDGVLLGDPIVVSDFPSGAIASVTITSLQSDYEILSVEKQDGSASITSPDNQKDQYKCNLYSLGGGSITVTLCEASEPPQVEGDEFTGGLVEYRVDETQALKMLYLAEVPVSAETRIESVKMKFIQTYGLQEEESFNKIGTGANNLAYWTATISAITDTGKPGNIRYLEISYDNGAGEQTARIPSGDLLYVNDVQGIGAAGDLNICEIKARNNDIHIVAFLIEAGGQLDMWSLYDVIFVENGENVGLENMPEPPEYATYEHSNWATDPNGVNEFHGNESITEDTMVYGMKSSSSLAGTEIHVMNTDNRLVNRVVELYNANHPENQITAADLDLESMKIKVTGDSASTNPDYSLNRWNTGSAYDYYFVTNSELPGLVDELTNHHVPHNEISSMTVYVETEDGTPIEVMIPRGYQAGAFSGTLTGNDNIFEIIINAAPDAPENEDLMGDPENPEDPGILGDEAVKVQCENSHAPETYAVLPGSYEIGAVTPQADGSYTCDITIKAEKYVQEYNTVYLSHTLVGESTKKVTLIWEDEDRSWVAQENTTPVVFDVTCDTTEKYNLTYDANGGYWGTASDTTRTETDLPAGPHTLIYSDTSAAADSPAPTHDPIQKDGENVKVLFVGWTLDQYKRDILDKDATGNDVPQLSTSINMNQDYKVYAVWAEDSNDNGVPDYQEKAITVNFDLKGGTTTDTTSFTLKPFPEKTDIKFGTAPTVTPPTGQEFVNWTLQSDPTESLGDKAYFTYKTIFEMTGGKETTVTFEANYRSSNAITVTFKVVHGTWSNGSSSNIEVTVPKDGSLTTSQIPTGMKPNSGYEGGSWDTTPNTTNKLNSNVTYTYTFTKSGDTEPEDEDCILYFDSNGGTEFKKIDNGNDSFRINPYSDSEYGQHIPSRPGYRFTGWYRDEDLENRISESTKINVNSIMTIYAGWERTSVPSMLNGDDHYAYIQGYADGTVRPNANITRAQVATIFFRLLDEDVRSDYLTTYNTFPDVNADYWANTAISTMASLGVINGRNSGLFDPDAYITRAEFAAICARFDDSNVSGFDSFTDTFGHWAEEEIGRAAALGWIQGYDDGTFRPNQYITRAQAVTMINRVLCRLPEDEDDLLPGMSVWTDCREGDWCYLAIQEATNSHDYVTKDRVYETWTDLNRAPDWSRYE